MATVVAFHAHPDDEVVLTGGTLARIAAEGHRVVVVAATDGFVGEPPDFTSTVDRIAELEASARVLGLHRVVHLVTRIAVMGRPFSPIRPVAYDLLAPILKRPPSA
jgi:LmbE family N-acetylglucosaminyl deacetylase